MFKLCYKEYPSKMSLDAMKQFKQRTGKDLWCLLLTLIEVNIKTAELTTVERMRQLYESCDFEIASHAFHSLCSKESVSIDEIQDGMFRTGWRPTERPDDMSEPWALVLLMLAYEVDRGFDQVPEEDKKKVDTSE